MNPVFDFILRVLCTQQLQILLAAHLFGFPTFRRRSFFVLRAIVSALPLLIGFDMLMRSDFRGTTPLFFIIPPVYCFGVLLFCYQCTARESLYSASCATALQNGVYNLFWIIKTVAGYSSYGWREAIVNTVLIILLYGSVYLVYRKWMHDREGHTLPRARVIQNALIILVFVVFFNFRAGDSKWEIFIYLAYVAADTLAILMQIGLLHETELKKENEIIEQLLESEQKKQRMTAENIELINRKCHDLKHQIEGLKRMDSGAERDRYIGEIEDAVLFYESTVKTGNETLDLILMEKQLYCKAHGITFTCICDGEKLDMMDAMDIYALFGNAIDNAIESVTAEDEKNRAIGLRVGQRSAFLTIHIENYLGRELKLVDGLPVTTKDVSYHGFGVLSIRHIVGKYHGTMSIRTDQNRFRLDILIPCKEG